MARGDTVTLVADNPQPVRSNPRKRSNPKTTKVAGLKMTFPQVEEILGGVVGVIAAVILPKLLGSLIINRLTGTMSPKMQEGARVLGGAVVNGVIAAAASTQRGVPKSAVNSFVLVAGITHLAQLVQASGFNFLTPAGTSFALPAAVTGPRRAISRPAIAGAIPSIDTGDGTVAAPASRPAPVGEITLVPRL